MSAPISDVRPSRAAPAAARRALRVAVHVAVFVAFGACHYVVVGWVAPAVSETPAPTCIRALGQSPRRVLWLHCACYGVAAVVTLFVVRHVI